MNRNDQLVDLNFQDPLQTGLRRLCRVAGGPVLLEVALYDVVKGFLQLVLLQGLWMEY